MCKGEPRPRNDWAPSALFHQRAVYLSQSQGKRCNACHDLWNNTLFLAGQNIQPDFSSDSHLINVAQVRCLPLSLFLYTHEVFLFSLSHPLLCVLQVLASHYDLQLCHRHTAIIYATQHWFVHNSTCVTHYHNGRVICSLHSSATARVTLSAKIKVKNLPCYRKSCWESLKTEIYMWNCMTSTHIFY